jgi:hypothetical protein
MLFLLVHLRNELVHENTVLCGFPPHARALIRPENGLISARNRCLNNIIKENVALTVIVLTSPRYVTGKAGGPRPARKRWKSAAPRPAPAAPAVQPRPPEPATILPTVPAISGKPTTRIKTRPRAQCTQSSRVRTTQRRNGNEWPDTIGKTGRSIRRRDGRRRRRVKLT